MSSADATLEDATSVQGQAPRREPLQRRRLDLIYFALAGFDLLTIGLTLMLSNHIVDLYQQSVNRSAFWSTRVSEVVELAQFAQEANAPGNDVFDSQDVPSETLRRDESLRLYAEQRDEVLRALEGAEQGENVSRVTAHLRTADQHMNEMMREADRIFAEIDAGDDAAAGRRMATMDRIYGRLSRSLLNAILALQHIEDANLQRQVQLASNLRSLELVVMALIFIIVLGVAFYSSDTRSCGRARLKGVGKCARLTRCAVNSALSSQLVCWGSLRLAQMTLLRVTSIFRLGGRAVRHSVRSLGRSV